MLQLHLKPIRATLLRALHPVLAGRSTGEAFVQLSQPERTPDCIAQRNRQQMGHRYIECVIEGG